MMVLYVDHFLQNLSFGCLLFLFFFYWAHVSFVLNPLIGFLGMGMANAVLLLLLVLRWSISGHFPVSNLYESLLFLSWSFTTFHLIVEKRSNLSFLGIITTPMALFTNAFATFSLPPEMQRATVLVPALQSNWLMMHVTIMIISYAALILGCLLSMAFLIINYTESQNYKKGSHLPSSHAAESTAAAPSMLRPATMTHYSAPSSSQSRSSLPHNTPWVRPDVELGAGSTMPRNDSTLAQRLDNLSYRTLGLGFPLLTIGILSGAVWANEAWGSYWSWDPKETWAFITWLVFAIYLHTRITKNWTGTKPAIIASVGFVVIWICYLGVNLLGTGLHSYGWFQQ